MFNDFDTQIQCEELFGYDYYNLMAEIFEEE